MARELILLAAKWTELAELSDKPDPSNKCQLSVGNRKAAIHASRDSAIRQDRMRSLRRNARGARYKQALYK
jgi:hypothetical protein